MSIVTNKGAIKVRFPKQCPHCKAPEPFLVEHTDGTFRCGQCGGNVNWT